MPLEDTSSLDFEEQQVTFAPKVYISYRPEDNANTVRAIRDWFLLRLGPMNVTIDVEIPPFVGSIDYYLRDKLTECDIFVPVIGPQWGVIMRQYQNANIDDQILIEMRIALDENLVIAPVCIAGAQPPREIDLPTDLRPMAELSYSHLVAGGQFEENMEGVIQNMQLAAVRHESERPHIDTEAHFAAFEEAYERHDLEEALTYLQELHDYGIVPRPFRLQLRQRIRRIRRQIERREGRPIYDYIRDVANHEPDQALVLLSLFLSAYPDHGDPDDLLDRLSPPSPEARQIVSNLHDRAMTARERLRLGDRLAELGDPRLGVGLRPDGVPDIRWIKIPEGSFISGFDKRIELPTFYISAYPLTVAQFLAFVDDGGYENPIWWEDLARHEDEVGDPRWTISSYPYVRVSWFDAVAFSRWLSEHLGTEVRLPTEDEWEKAARGTTGSIYPWGDNYMAGYSNINEVISGISPNNLRQATPVGIYPHGASPFGVYDMIGNVWEWALNQFYDPTITSVGGEDKRSLRGGAWSSDRLFAHTVRRRGELPGTRFNDIGFRIVCDRLPHLPGRED